MSDQKTAISYEQILREIGTTVGNSTLVTYKQRIETSTPSWGDDYLFRCPEDLRAITHEKKRRLAYIASLKDVMQFDLNSARYSFEAFTETLSDDEHGRLLDCMEAQQNALRAFMYFYGYFRGDTPVAPAECIHEDRHSELIDKMWQQACDELSLMFEIGERSVIAGIKEVTDLIDQNMSLKSSDLAIERVVWFQQCSELTIRMKALKRHKQQKRDKILRKIEEEQKFWSAMPAVVCGW